MILIVRNIEALMQDEEEKKVIGPTIPMYLRIVTVKSACRACLSDFQVCLFVCLFIYLFICLYIYIFIYIIMTIIIFILNFVLSDLNVQNKMSKYI